MADALGKIPTSLDFVDQCKLLVANEKGLAEPLSDYALAKHFGWSVNRISGYRTGRTTLGEDAAQQVAECLGISLETVLACVALERARKEENDTVAQAWERVCHRVALAAAPFFCGFYAVSEVGSVVLSL